LIGATVSHYQILERLGGGGMGVVYKARDLRLDRLAALKFLASQRGAPEEQKRRFIREAKAASALDHPNLCTIYEIGETEDGALFIAMALYEGETLRDRVRRGSLPVEEAIEIAAQIASGLAAAHERGIVHRDVKAANVILTAGGPVKLVDFGVAKLADQSRLTRAGMAMGTTAYMSPEQFRGEPAGPRADIWSLGVLLYQMVTGRLPFEERSETETIRAILERDPRPLAALQPTVPAALERIVARLLAKQPADRYARMEEVRADLRDLAAEIGSPEGTDEDRTLMEIPASPLQPGTAGSTVGHYEILESLGGGGMGVVFKARDTRLDRVVALKFLPPELTRDPEAKRRFMQEARTASALDHPNLCTILELEETPDGQLYLAMPCYDGETLRRKLERGPLPVDDALDYGEQIARGLAKAHHNGIVHCDVKPANLVVTGDGVVKILDFGLAKLAGSAAVSRTGSSAGTPAYMSPEQARGEQVDHRTDLWSLGVVLYEMLAGQRPFRAEREQAVIYTILNERPQPLREIRSEVSPELAHIVDRLLAKEPADRYATADEAFAALRILRGATLTGSMRMPGPRASVRPWVWAGAAAAMGLVLAGLYFLPRLGGPEKAVPLQATFTRLTDQEGRELFPSLSPDGEYFVYARETASGNLDVYLQRVGGSNPINLTADSPVEDTQPAYSPDGKQIAFRSDRDGGGIFLMGATGESVRRLTDFGYNPAWSPDGREILVATEGISGPGLRLSRSRLVRVNVGTGQPRPIVLPGDAVQPSWSPRGLRIAYWGVLPGNAERVIWTVPAQGGAPVRVTRDQYLNWNPVWSPGGDDLYYASDRSGSMNLWRVRIDELSGRVLGRPEPVTTPSSSSFLLSFSRDGRRILYTADESKANLERADFDPINLRVTSGLTPVTQGSRAVRIIQPSPDGRWVVFDTAAPRENLFVLRSDGSGLRQLTDDLFKNRLPSWSPDGKRILFYSNRSGTYQLWTVRPDGGGMERIIQTREPLYEPIWSPDGRQILCRLEFTGSVLIDMTVPPERRRPRPLPIQGGLRSFTAQSWSPDGKWLIGSSSGPGIYAYSFDTRKIERWIDRGTGSCWLRDGRRILYRNEGKVLAFDRRTRKIQEVLAPAGNSAILRVAPSPDNRTLYLVRGTQEGDVWMLAMK
jgi:eukaryotic-like serine/threonine-protein kinase